MTLAHEPFFSGTPRRALARIASTARPAAFPDGHRLFDEGGAADRFWILQEGAVVIDLQVPGRGAVVIETLGPGDVLGWSWLHAPYRWRFGACARTPVRAIEFDAPLLRALCAVDPAMAYELSRRFTEIIVDRLQATRMRLPDLYAHPAEQR
ncbi:Crp/Fnr family transcriptional regulator [Actinomadura rugatobispora]|uniref:Crp/Fnr family transcriptional regulator n=1 Tax=Actinomadura rugatobispora TaxID=1994 RepID=A0ABW0ZTZ7_9ACTN